MTDRPARRPKPEPSAYQRALGLLVRREHSRRELGSKLRARGAEPEEAAAALDTLARQDFQNDARFAEALARTRAASGQGPIRIRAELGMHGLDRETVEAALAACERDWLAVAGALVARRFQGKVIGDPAVRRRAVDFLLRRGFDQRTALAAVRAGGHSADED
jgi:regulatory protein